MRKHQDVACHIRKNKLAHLFLCQVVNSRVGHTTFFHSVANLDEEVSLSLLCSINLLTPCNRLQLTLAAVTSPSGMCLTWWPCQLLQGDQDVLWLFHHISLWGLFLLLPPLLPVLWTMPSSLMQTLLAWMLVEVCEYSAALPSPPLCGWLPHSMFCNAIPPGVAPNWPVSFLYQFVNSRVGHTTFFHSVANLGEVSLSLCSLNILSPCNRLQFTQAAAASLSQMCLTWWPCQLLQGNQDVLWLFHHISLWGLFLLLPPLLPALWTMPSSLMQTLLAWTLMEVPL